MASPTHRASPAHRTSIDRSRRLLSLGLIPVVGLLAAACGSSGGQAATTTTTTTTLAPSVTAPTPTTGSHPVVTTMTVDSLGKILVNAQGQVLYSFTKDGVPVPCSASCLAVWPAVTLPAGVTTPTGSSRGGHPRHHDEPTVSPR